MQTYNTIHATRSPVHGLTNSYSCYGAAEAKNEVIFKLANLPTYKRILFESLNGSATFLAGRRGNPMGSALGAIEEIGFLL